MSGVTIVDIQPQDDGMRLNRWFMKYYPYLPLSRLQKLLRTKQIKIDGKKVDIAVKLQAGQHLRIPPLQDKPEVRGEHKINNSDAEYIKSLVIYKDENIIVLNKPSGLAVQGGTNTKKHIDGMLEALRFEKDENPKLVHRIDKDTSGILVLARDRQNAELLTTAFRKKDIAKTYLAIIQGVPDKKDILIDAPLLKQGERMIVSATGQRAISELHLIDALSNKFSLVYLSPKTGRTHQLRAHMQHIGTPILGDDKYFIKSRLKLNDVADKLYLHAYKIDLSSIYKGVIIEAKLPQYFAQALDILGLELK